MVSLLSNLEGPGHRRKRLFLPICLFVIFLLFLSTTAGAKTIWKQRGPTAEQAVTKEKRKIQLGRLRISPLLAVSGVYDSNIYLANGYTNDPDNPGTTRNGELIKPLKSDYLLQVMPGLLLNYPLPGERGGISLGYQGNWAFYKNTTSQDWNNQTGVFALDYKAPGGLIVAVYDNFNSGNDPYGDATQYDLGQTRQRWRNDLKGTVGWDFSDRFKVLGFYNYFKQKYKDIEDFSQNWTDNEFGLGADIKVLPRTWAFLNYHHGSQNFDTDWGNTTSENNASNKWDRVNVGLKWDSGAKIGGQLNFGYGWLSFDNRVDPQGREYKGTDTWIAATSINYKILSTSTLSLTIYRTVRPTGANKAEFYDDTMAGININQDLPYKFSAAAGFFYGLNEYNTLNYQGTEDRTDNNYNANIGFKYKIRSWLNAGLGYRYMRKDSNDITQSFTDNRVTLTIGASY